MSTYYNLLVSKTRNNVKITRYPSLATCIIAMPMTNGFTCNNAITEIPTYLYLCPWYTTVKYCYLMTLRCISNGSQMLCAAMALWFTGCKYILHPTLFSRDWAMNRNINFVIIIQLYNGCFKYLEMMHWVIQWSLTLPTSDHSDKNTKCSVKNQRCITIIKMMFSFNTAYCVGTYVWT